MIAIYDHHDYGNNQRICMNQGASASRAPLAGLVEQLAADHDACPFGSTANSQRRRALRHELAPLALVRLICQKLQFCNAKTGLFPVPPTTPPSRRSDAGSNQANRSMSGDDARGQPGQAHPDRHKPNGAGMTWASRAGKLALSYLRAVQGRPGTGETCDAVRPTTDQHDIHFRQQTANRLRQHGFVTGDTAVTEPIQAPASVIRALGQRRHSRSAPVGTADARGGKAPNGPAAVVESLDARILKRYEKRQVTLDDVMKVTTSNIKTALSNDTLSLPHGLKAPSLPHGVAPGRSISRGLPAWVGRLPAGLARLRRLRQSRDGR